MCNSVLKMQHVCVATYCDVYACMGFVTHDKCVCMCRLLQMQEEHMCVL